MRRSAPGSRPPLLLGCVIAMALLGLLAVAGGSLVAFLESGSSTGRVTLDPLGAYAIGTVTRFPEDGFYIVRLLDGSTLALSDLDAANRAATGRRCRVAPIPAADPGLAEALEEYSGRFSAGAETSMLVFREDCFGALYDAAGIRLDLDEPNLDRLELGLDDAGNLVVETAKRECSKREDGAIMVPVDCP